MLTPRGREWVWQRAAGVVDDPVETVRVTGATEVSSVPVLSLEIIPEEGATILRARASFGAKDANFEWLKRELVTGAGVSVDATARDFGRKVLGAVWDVEIDMTLRSEDDDGEG